MKQNLHFYKRLGLLSCLLFLLPFAATAQTTVSVYATGTIGSYNTGSVNVSGQKFDGHIDSVSIGNVVVPLATAFRGWAGFDLSSIPAGATITSATLYFTTYNGTTSSGALNTISGFLGSPSAMTGVNLYNAIVAGTTINSSSWTANGLQTQPLNTAGITFLQANVGGPINVGFMRAGYLAYHIYGYPAATANQPRLDITYTVSNQCATITSVTATGPSSVCAGTSFTLASATLPAAAGFTFQWESSPAGTNTWTPISGATASTYATSQSVATDYRLLVTCPATSATGTSNTVAVAQNNFNTCYCPATVGYVLNDEITNVLLGTINNTSACASLVGTQGTAVGGADIYSDFTGSTVPIPGLMQGIAQTLSVDLSSCGAASTTREVKAYIDYDQNGLFTDPGEEIIVYPHGNPNSAVYTATVTFTVPATATLGNTRMRIILGQGLGSIVSPCSVNLSYGEAEDYTVNIVQAVPCSGLPTAGTASGPATVCSGLNFNLNLAVGTVGTGLNIQWESSPAGTNTWTAISGATAASYTVTGGQTVATDYRAVVTCTNGGGADISNTVAVAMSPFYLCYCSPHNGANLNGTNTFNYLTNVSIPNTDINNTNTTGGYTLYYPTTATTTDTLFQGIQYTINTTHTYSGSYNSFAWIDYDASGTFDASEYIALTTNNLTGTATFIVPLTATPGLTGMRIRHYFGSIAAADACSVNGSYETEDYVIVIGTSPQCAGIPVAGIASGPVTACSGINFNLSLTGYTIGQGIDIEWQMYDAATSSWIPMTGGTAPIFTVTGGQVAATDYRAKITCINGGGNDFSNTVSVGMSPFFLCYCSPDNGVSLNGTNTFNYLTGVEIANSTFYNVTTVGGYNRYYPSTASTTTSFVQGAQYTINTTHTYSGAPYNSFLWIDYDGSGTFDASEYTALTTTGLAGTATFMVPITAVPGQTGMRVRHYYGTIAAGNACSVNGSYETEDYVVTIVATTPCAGIPNTAVVTGPANACAATPFTLTATGYTIGTGISFQWEFFNTTTSTWDPMPGSSTSPTYVVANQTAATDYRFTTFCANGGGNSVSNTLSVGQNPATQCYCPPLYVNGCSSSDDIDDMILTGDVAPGINNLNTPCPATGYQDYTAMSASLSPGLTYSGNVTTNYTAASEDVNIWIDYNQNGVFETTESVATIDNISNTSTGAFSFTVPASTPLGSYRMRVRLVWGQAAASGLDPCISYGYGEAHDYTINISAPPTCMPPTGLNATNATASSVDLAWTSSAAQHQIEYAQNTTFTPGTGTRVGPAGVSNPYTLGGLTPGIYSYYVRDICAPNDTSAWNGPFTFAPVPANDDCLNAIDITSGAATNGYNINGTQSQATCNATSPLVYDVWYSFTTGSVGGSVTVTVNTTNTGMDAMLEAFDGTCGSLTSMTATAAGTSTNLVCIDGPAAGIETATYTVLANTTYYVRVYGYNTTPSGTFVIQATGTPLSIKLRDISATNIGEKNRVDWSTVSEATGDMFDLERSADGENFSRLNTISARGKASTYSYWDEKPFAGINHYRLKMVDATGKFTYSETVTAKVKGAGTFTVEAYPNPVSEVLTVKVYGIAAANATVTITDVTGKTVQVVTVVNNQATIDMGSLAHGTYLVKYLDSHRTQTIKVNKQ